MQRPLTSEDLHAELLPLFEELRRSPQSELRPLFEELLRDLRQEVQRILTTLEAWGLADSAYPGHRRPSIASDGPALPDGPSLLNVPDEQSRTACAVAMMRDFVRPRSVRISPEVDCQDDGPEVERSPTTQTLPARLPSDKESEDIGCEVSEQNHSMRSPYSADVRTESTEGQATPDAEHAWMTRQIRRFKTKDLADEEAFKPEASDHGLGWLSPKYGKAAPAPKTNMLSSAVHMTMGAMWHQKAAKTNQGMNLESGSADGRKCPEASETPLRSVADEHDGISSIAPPSKGSAEDRASLRGRFLLNKEGLTDEIYNSDPMSRRSINGRSLGVCSNLCRTVRHFVRSPAFDYVVILMVLLNSILIGIQTDHIARHEVSNPPLTFRILESLFAVLFTIELTMNLSVYGWSFFTKKDWAWNMFDCLLVGSQLLEEFVSIIFFGYYGQHKGFNLSVLRLLRILRLVRVVRLIRVLRFVSELRTLVSGIIRSIRSLIWTMVLLFLVLYVAAVYLTQLVSDHVLEDASGRSSLRRFYGSVDISLLSLFQSITGGIDWNDLASPLVENISPWLAVVFSLYIAFTVIAMLNIITGVFVESALKSAKADNDTLMIGNMREVFNDASTDGKMSWTDFQDQLDKPLMQDYFKAIDVDPSEAKGLFRLIDIDMDGSIDHEEFLSGCLRLRGSAKALDLNLLLHEVKRLYKSFQRHGRVMEMQQKFVLKALNALPHHSSSADAMSVLPSLDGGHSSMVHHEDVRAFEEATRPSHCDGETDASCYDAVFRGTTEAALTHQSSDHSLS